MTVKPLIFYWRKPKTQIFVYVPKFERYEEVTFMRGVLLFGTWFIGVYSFGKREDKA